MIRNISRKEFAARAGLSLRTFDQMVANGQVPTGRKIGSRSFWLEPVVDAWVIRAAGHPYPAPELPEVLQKE
ncbi:MAG: helix-turn-helix transcriptional regulator, partial [Cardiobacterium hominis]